MGPRNSASPIVRVLTSTADPHPFWALHGPRLYFPALPRPLIAPQHRPFHNTNPCAAGSIFDISNLSISRESRFLAKTQGRPRTDFSPHLELIRSSEVEPFTERRPKGEEKICSHGDGCAHLRELLGNEVSMANTLEELASTRAARESTEREMEELQKWFTRWKRLCDVMVLANVVLFSGLVFHDEVRDTISKIMLGRARAAVTSQVERDREESLNDSGDQSRDHDGSVFRDDNVASASVKEHRHRSVVSRLLWASGV